MKQDEREVTAWYCYLIYTVTMELRLLVCLLLAFGQSHGQVYPQPEQVHLSYGGTPSEMIVTWVTMTATSQSIVEYYQTGQGPIAPSVAIGNSTVFTDGGSAKRKLYIHRVTLTDLQPTSTYTYHCGSPDGWSSLFSFRTFPQGTNWSPRFAIYGDMGNINAQSLPRLQEDTMKGMYDAILHVGDFAYNMDTNDAKYGDEFMRQIEPIAATIPYMTCVGNHEAAYNFSNYVNRFTMKGLDGKINNLFYSWNVGPAHIISFSTEFYFFLEYGWLQIAEQYKWLQKDLAEAASPENRAIRPWIITMAHRPIYCTNSDGPDCFSLAEMLRKGIPIIKAYGLEDLFYKYGVDLSLWAHEHSYERLWPVYDNIVCNGSIDEPYRNPKAPVHIITGSAGCQEDHDPFGMYQPWSAFRSDDYGYTRMMIINNTHIYLEQVSDDQGGKVVDKMTLIKDIHGPEAWL